MMKLKTLTAFLLLPLIVASACSGPQPHPEAVALCQTGAIPGEYTAPRVYADGSPVALDDAVLTLMSANAILIGEQHDRYDHHLNQVELICRLHAAGKPLAIGFEAFQQSFQAQLDEYVRGETDLTTLLERTEYYSRWRFDHRLYAPLFEFAKTNGIPMVALNVSRAQSRALAERRQKDEAAPLKAEERDVFPYGLKSPSSAYRKRIAAFFERHPKAAGADVNRFTLVQWMWDSAMGQAAARYLDKNPSRTIVVIAGSGHVAYADAIPGQLLDARPATTVARVLQAVVRPGTEGGQGLLAATNSEAIPPARDIWMGSKAVELTATGKLGVFLATTGGDVEVSSVAEGKAASRAGIKKGDRIIAIASRPTSSYTAVKVALSRFQPSDTVSVDVLRAGEAKPLSFQVTLE